MYIHAPNFSLSTLENTDRSKLYACSLTTSNFAKFSTLLKALWWHQLFNSRWSKPQWWVLRRTKHMSADMHARIFFVEHSGEDWWEQTLCLFAHHKNFGKVQQLASSTLVTSFVLYSLIRTALMGLGMDKTRIYGYARSKFFLSALWRTLTRRNFMFVHSPQTIWQGTAPCLEHSGTSVVLCSLTRAPLMSPGKGKIRVCGYIIYIYIYIYIHI